MPVVMIYLYFITNRKRKKVTSIFINFVQFFIFVIIKFKMLIHKASFHGN